MGSFQSIDFPKSLRYSSLGDRIPMEFFDSVFPLAKEMDMVLGYFSSSAIRELSGSIALFLYGGGKLRIITNQFYSEEDYNSLFKEVDLVDQDKFINLFKDLESLKNNLSSQDQHFFDCLKYLIKENRLELIPVKYNSGLAHTKNFILRDHFGNTIAASGSLNFTLSGIILNNESLSVYLGWEGPRFQAAIEDFTNEFQSIYNKTNKEFTYLEGQLLESKIETIGEEKDIEQIIQQSHELLKRNSSIKEKVLALKTSREERFNRILREEKLKPIAPNWFKPRPYQIKAYNNWIKNSRNGIFNMATGTGKTLTSLNIIYEEYLKYGHVNLFILVPTSILLDQWVEECRSFNLINIITSKDTRYHEDLRRLSRRVGEEGFAPNFVFITTYANFSRKKFQLTFSKLNFPELTCIFDECHNVGSRSMNKVLPMNIKYRIGLSATPQRMFDDYGNNKMYDYFNSNPDCFTFTYGMLKAIKNNMLCPYYYHPIFVYLNEDELKDYKAFTPKLMANFDSHTNKFTEEGERLLMLRKQIIHKAVNKLTALKRLISELDDLKYTFIYAPEGNFINADKDEFDEEEEDVRIIKEYTSAVNSLGYRARSLTGYNHDRDKSLEDFKEGRLDTLVAMKVLDEGVNIPITRKAIFCSSTGNPRQFIQRRGRVLRKHEASKKEYAEIYDLIVLPYDPFTHEEDIIPLEKRIIHSEVIRAADFAYAAINKELLMDSELNEICTYFNIDLANLMLERELNEKKCDYENIE